MIVKKHAITYEGQHSIITHGNDVDDDSDVGKRLLISEMENLCKE